MNRGSALAVAIALAATSAAITGCDNQGGPMGSGSVRQTGFPGQVSAGGGTSGEVMARNASATDTNKASPSGTPHIPQGSGGNTGGASMGGTTGGAVSQPAGAGAGAKEETLRGQSAQGGVSGTPGIPEGSGGTTSGAAMGGTTDGAATTEAVPAPGGANPAVPAQGGADSAAPAQESAK